MRVVGVDLSLTSTGIAVGTTDTITVRRYRTNAKDYPDTLPGRSERLRTVCTGLWGICYNADLVVIEAPALRSVTGHAFDRAGLWWMLVGRLTAAYVPVAAVSPATLKVYGRGVGKGDKDEMLAAVVRRWTDVNVQGHDEADALLLCSMGLRHLGVPYEQLPQSHTRALAAVAWPSNMKGATA